MKYIIMCGGEYTTWSRPRQTLLVKGEPIVARTIRLLKENGAEDICISSNDPVFEAFAPVIYHNNRYKAYKDWSNGCWTDCFYLTGEPVTYIFGDVIFSPNAIRTIAESETDDIELFASAPPFAPEYVKKWAEPFALKVTDTAHLRKAIRQTEIFQKQRMFKRRPIMWELWQVIKGYPFNEIHYDSYTHINDYTCDVDSPGDLHRIERMIK